MSASTPTGIYTPGSIWAKAIEQSKAEKKADSKGLDAYVYFVGAKGSGKSTLLNRFLYPNQVNLPKPSQGLEYTFARKASTFDHERKDLAHIWEVAGSYAFAGQMALGSQIFLTYRQVTTAVVVMVLDLSDPCSVLPCALRWLGLIKQKLATTYSLFERKGLQLPEQLKARQRAKLLSQHDDKGLVDCTGVSLVLACTKWDVFRDAVDAEGQKVMARTLRWLAHSYAAHLMYLGGLQPGEGAGSASGSSRSSSQHTQQQLMDNFSRLLNHTMFVGMDRKMPLKMALQFDHLGPLMIPAGSDKFKDIGRPQAQMPAVLTAADVAAIQQEWVGMASELFPAMKQQEQKERFEMDVRYREEGNSLARFLWWLVRVPFALVMQQHIILVPDGNCVAK
eukprot:GHRR01006607.1.p1 GENE.GHRR01006607.1~~GHRR01006607.1.p1  ORF type:complete len:393 (+),score=130.27 GHRR01006607.1:184-1362(+)